MNKKDLIWAYIAAVLDLLYQGTRSAKRVPARAINMKCVDIGARIHYNTRKNAVIAPQPVLH